MLPERSQAAKYAKSAFYEGYNDIDVFVEDTKNGYEKIFYELINRVLSDTYRVSKIFQLGGRTPVLDECRKNHHKIKRPTLYIIDGDLHLLTGSAPPEIPGLYEFPFYCLENIFIDKDAIIEYMNQEDSEKKRGELSMLLDFDHWHSHNVENLLSLFIDYATCFKLCPKIKTVSHPVKNIISSNSGLVDKDKIYAQKEYVKNEALSIVSKELYEETKNLIEARANTSKENLSKFISAKDYLVPLLFMKIRSITGTKASNNNIKLRLAMMCKIDLIADCIYHIANPISDKNTTTAELVSD